MFSNKPVSVRRVDDERTLKKDFGRDFFGLVDWKFHRVRVTWALRFDVGVDQLIDDIAVGSPFSRTTVMSTSRSCE